MFCENCGYPAKPTDRFCQHCGAQLMNGGSGYENYETPVAESQQTVQYTTPVAESQRAVQDTTPVQKRNSKKPKLAVVIVSIFVVGFIAIAIGGKLLFNSGIYGILNQYCKAVASLDEEKMLSIYNTDKEGEQAVDEFIQETYQLHEKMSEQCGEEFKVSYKTVGISESKDVYMITLQFQAHGKEGDYFGKLQRVVVYKSENNWYIDLDERKMFKDFIEEDIDSKSDRQKQLDDISHGGNISTAIQAALGNQEAWNAMQDNPYSGQVMPIEDITLLPDAFVKEFQSAMPKIPEIEYTKNGATGYAVLLSTEPGKIMIKVYISSKDKLDEWEVSPVICDEYSKDTTDE